MSRSRILLLVLAFVSIFVVVLGVFPYTRNAFLATFHSDQVDRAKAIAAGANPVNLFVLVTDAEDQPLPQVRVDFYVVTPSYPEIYRDASGPQSSTVQTLITNEQGIVNLVIPKALFVRIDDLSVVGYKWDTSSLDDELQGAFYYGKELAVRGSPDRKPHQDGPENKYILRMAKDSEQSLRMN